MPSWKRDETVFDVAVNKDGTGGYLCRLPKPVKRHMKIGNRVRFEIKKNGTVVVTKGTGRGRPPARG